MFQEKWGVLTRLRNNMMEMHNLEKAMVTRIVESDGVQKESEIEFCGNEPSRRYVIRSI
jgi:hypothetical protein